MTGHVLYISLEYEFFQGIHYLFIFKFLLFLCVVRSKLCKNTYDTFQWIFLFLFDFS